MQFLAPFLNLTVPVFRIVSPHNNKENNIKNIDETYWNSERLMKLARLSQTKDIKAIAKHFNKKKSEIRQVCKAYGIKPMSFLKIKLKKNR